MPREPDHRRPTVGVVTVDDHATFRRSIRDVIDATPGFELLGEAASGEAALGVVAELSPALVILDVRMPGMDGFETARRLRSTHPAATVILVSSDDIAGRPATRAARTPLCRSGSSARQHSGGSGMSTVALNRNGSPSPDDVRRRPTSSNGGRVVEDYKTTLRRLALRDDRYIESLLADERESAALSKLDPGTHALARVGALIAMDAAPPSYMNAVEAAGDAGVTHEEIVGTLIAVLRVVRSRACRLGSAEPGPGDRIRRRRRPRAARAGSFLT